jgi:hypothetical protein
LIVETLKGSAFTMVTWRLSIGGAEVAAVPLSGW